MTSDVFLLRPYVQNPANDAITLTWLSKASVPGKVAIQKLHKREVKTYYSMPKVVSTLGYSAPELAHLKEGVFNERTYQHSLRVTGLSPGSVYQYKVLQGSLKALGSFQTAPDNNTAIRFVVYADSETEPESSGKHSKWPPASGIDSERVYLVDQTTGYRENLKVIAEREPNFIAIAGDLVQSGGEQRDWDEFWRHNESIASNIPIFPALGNHEYYAGPGEFGAWATRDTERSIKKFQTYFDVPDNGARKPEHNERYYALEYGPISLIVLDLVNGDPHQTSSDTNWSMLGEGDGAIAPSWHEGSDQYSWLVDQLASAQERSRFTLVMFHYCPYTSGVHGLPPGPDSEKSNNTSSLPLQALTPLFMQYGVDALLNGHGEMLEHSVLKGLELTRSKLSQEQTLHVYDTGIGGDGLRGPHPDVINPYRRFLAHVDSPEKYDQRGVLVDGGKHYGHIEVNVLQDGNGLWKMELDLVYVFPLTNFEGTVLSFERRLYDDKTVLFERN